MGADAGMALVLNRPWKSWEIKALNDRLVVIFWTDLFQSVKLGDIVVGPGDPQEKKEVWNEAICDHKIVSGDCILYVDVETRYFDETYCRGSIGPIFMLAEFAERATGCEVFYWSTENVEGVDFDMNLFNREARLNLLDKLAQDRIRSWGSNFECDVGLSTGTEGKLSSVSINPPAAQCIVVKNWMCPFCGHCKEGLKIGPDGRCKMCRENPAKK